MKKILAVVLVGVMALSFAACGKKCDTCGKTKGGGKEIMGVYVCGDCIGDMKDIFGGLN